MPVDLMTIVCCTPDKPERRAHMSALCRAEGLLPEFTTDLGLFVHRAACAGLRGDFPAEGGGAYRAHYLTYLAALRHFVGATARTHVLMLEDDIVRTAGSEHVARIVARAPGSFDCLFLEYCYGNCGAGVRFESSDFVYGYAAACTGACVFSRAGAHAFLEFADASAPTVIDVLTVRYATTVRGHERVVYLDPPAFGQDRTLFPDGVTGFAQGSTGVPPVCGPPWQTVLLVLAVAALVCARLGATRVEH
jgi:hypothetical protein